MKMTVCVHWEIFLGEKTRDTVDCLAGVPIAFFFSVQEKISLEKKFFFNPKGLTLYYRQPGRPYVISQQ